MRIKVLRVLSKHTSYHAAVVIITISLTMILEIVLLALRK
jgi:hypothetical protein